MSKQNLTCANCDIRHLTLFADLPESIFQDIDYQPCVTRHRANDVLIPQASRTDSIYTIREGIVKFETRLSDGSKRIVRLMKRGDTLGLQGWQMGTQPYEIIALSEVELCRIPYSAVDALRQRSETLNQELITRCCHDSQQADMWITHFSTGSVNRRVAYLLLFLLEIQQLSQHETVRLLSRDDMAAILGVRQESISRTVTQFKREGLLTQLKKDIYEMDEAGLQQKILKNPG
jgi:CRP/FNR family transcriptional regulator, anaerobic regulatory protein